MTCFFDGFAKNSWSSLIPKARFPCGNLQVLEPTPMAGRVDFLTDLGTIEEGSPLDIELKEAGLDQNRSQLSATWKACSLSV